MRWIPDPPTLHLRGWTRGSPEDDNKKEREAELQAQVENIKAMFFGSENWDLETYESGKVGTKKSGKRKVHR